jgi:hypothetical protein
MKAPDYGIYRERLIDLIVAASRELGMIPQFDPQIDFPELELIHFGVQDAHRRLDGEWSRITERHHPEEGT